MGMELMPELGGDDPVFPLVPSQEIADKGFRQVVAVAFGGIDQVDAELLRFI